MSKEQILEIRKRLSYILSKYVGEPVLLNKSEEILRQILFEENENGELRFALERKLLDNIDFSNVSFDGVSISGENFYYLKGVKINPQTIKNKDLSNCVFYGVTFIGSFDGTCITGSNFAGSTGAIINPQTVFDKNLEGTRLDSVKIIGSFDGVNIVRTDFRWGSNVIINPQTIKNKDFRYTKLWGVNFTHDFEGANIIGADFTGSIGAKIDSSRLICEDGDLKVKSGLYKVNLNGAYLTNGLSVDDFNALNNLEGALFVEDELSENNKIIKKQKGN